MEKIEFENIDRTSPEMLAARKQDLLKDLHAFASEANRQRVHELLGLPQEIDETQLKEVPNYRALLKSRLASVAGSNDEAPESGERALAAAQLLGGINAYDRVESEASEAAA